MFGVWNYCAKMIDLTSKRIKSTQAVLKEGDWNFTQLGHYTSISPLVVSSGAKVKITFQEGDVTYQAGVGLITQYDFINQKFIASTLNDVFMVEVRMKVKPSAQSGYMDLLMESPTFGFNPINASTQTFTKSAGDEHFISSDFLVFIGEDVLSNGIEFYIHPVDTNVQVYDISYFIVRLSSGK
jgi:hypothetical protein